MQGIDGLDVPEDLSRRTRSAMAQASVWRRRRTNASRVMAAAVILLVVLGLAVVWTQTLSSQALAQVIERVKATKTLRAVLTDPGGKGRLLISGTHRRLEDDSNIVIADAVSRRELTLQSKQRSAIRGAQRATSAGLDFYGVFRALQGASTTVEDYVDNAGRRYPGLRGQATLKIDRDVTWKVEAKIWSDPATKLPVRLEIKFPVQQEDGRDVVVLLDQIEFDVPLDDALFDMSIPPGYTVVGIYPDEVKPAPSEAEAAKLTIVPGIGIGEVKFGMSREQIVAILGEPEFTNLGAYLCYPSRGLQLILVGREPDRLGMIIANPMDLVALTRNEFPGQTDKGIRMGSSEQQVREAYGAPDPPLPTDKGQGIARYGKLAIMFGFVDGKVQQIIAERTD